jgi:hypothetical protein
MIRLGKVSVVCHSERSARGFFRRGVEESLFDF